MSLKPTLCHGGNRSLMEQEDLASQGRRCFEVMVWIEATAVDQPHREMT